jgi:hypothetical protein
VSVSTICRCSSCGAIRACDIYLIDINSRVSSSSVLLKSHCANRAGGYTYPSAPGVARGRFEHRKIGSALPCLSDVL